MLEPFEAKLHLVLTRAPRVRGWVRARVSTPRVPRRSLECHAAAPSTYGCRRHHIRSQALLHTVAGSLTYGCRLHLVASVLGCAAQLLRIDAIVPVRCRAQPGLQAGLPTASRRGHLRGGSRGGGGGQRGAADSQSDESGESSSSASDDSDEGTLV